MAAPRIAPEQAALLAAIVAEPDEDTPRLVYADWLQENGDAEQAAFIRESIRFARSGDPTGARAPCPSQPQAWEWLKRLGLEHASGHGFDRGFPRIVVFWNVNYFVNEAAALVARLPVGDVGVSWEHGRKVGEGPFMAMAAMPELARLHTLRLVDFINPLPLAGWERLVQSPYLLGLKTLVAGSCGLTDDHARALADSSNLGGLTALDLACNPISAEGVLAVLRSPHLTSLTRLSLVDNDELVWLEEYAPELYAELVAAVTERFGSDQPLHKCLD